MQTSNSRHHRHEPLDWLRGLLALSIMVYHLTFWQIGDTQADSLLGVMSIYGVAMFFVLSGLSMAIAYDGRLDQGSRWVRFFIARAFRILPLLWLAITTVTLVSIFVRHEPISAYTIVLNATGLFGFVDPAAYINTGAWSIGNEIVYYSLTPLLIALYQRNLTAGNVVLLASCIISIWFAFVALDNEKTLAEQWSLYINPFNNLALYLAGLALYYNTRAINNDSAVALACLCTGIGLFVLYPAAGDVVNIVTGSNRVVFCVASLLTVYGFYRCAIKLPVVIARLLTNLGLATYGIYLLHPIINSAATLALRKTGVELDPVIIIVTVSLASFATALLTYQLMELPMIRLGKKVSERIGRRQASPASHNASGMASIADKES